MKNKLGLWLLALVYWASMGCSSSPKLEDSEKGDDKQDEVVDFYKGADISWVTELESKGHKFYNVPKGIKLAPSNYGKKNDIDIFPIYMAMFL